MWTLSETDSKSHPLKQLTVDAAGDLDYYDPAGAQIVARQQLKPVYHRNGIAILGDVLGYLQCRVTAKHVSGDHDIIIGEVEEAMSEEGRPLLYYRGGYAQLER